MRAQIEGEGRTKSKEGTTVRKRRSVENDGGADGGWNLGPAQRR